MQEINDIIQGTLAAAQRLVAEEAAAEKAREIISRAENVVSDARARVMAIGRALDNALTAEVQPGVSLADALRRAEKLADSSASAAALLSAREELVERAFVALKDICDGCAIAIDTLKQEFDSCDQAIVQWPEFSLDSLDIEDPAQAIRLWRREKAAIEAAEAKMALEEERRKKAAAAAAAAEKRRAKEARRKERRAKEARRKERLEALARKAENLAEKYRQAGVEVVSTLPFEVQIAGTSKRLTLEEAAKALDAAIDAKRTGASIERALSIRFGLHKEAK